LNLIINLVSRYSLIHKHMTGKNRSLSKVMVIISLIVLYIPLYIQGLFIIVFNRKELTTSDQKTAYYLKQFPSFLRDSLTLSYVCLLTSALAVFLSIFCLNRTTGVLKTLAIISLIVSSLIGSLSLFQLM
jgi:hypothetical protein